MSYCDGQNCCLGSQLTMFWDSFSFVYIPVQCVCARPDCVTRKTLPPLSLHDPEPANWSLVCSTQATKVPAKAFKSRRVVQSLSVNVQWCPPSRCCRADGTDGGCLVAWIGLIQENKLLDFGWDYWEMARFITRGISRYVSNFRKRLIEDFDPTGTFKMRVDKTSRLYRLVPRLWFCGTWACRLSQ